MKLSLKLVFIAAGATLIMAAPMGAQGAHSNSSKVMRHAAALQTVTMAIRVISDMIPEHLCVDQGICAKYGINLQLQNFAGTSADIAAALQGGSVDLAYVAVTNVMQARKQGFDQVIIASAAGESKQNPTGQANALLVKDPSIRTGKDLEGKSVAVNGLQSASQAIVMAWIAKTGGDPSKVNYVGSIPDPQKPQAVASGQVAAGHVPEPYRSVGIGLGLSTIDAALVIRPKGLWIGAIAAKSTTLAARPTVFKNLIRALKVSADLANSNPTLAKTELKSFSPLAPDLIDKSNLPLLGVGVDVGNFSFWESLINRFFGAQVSVNPYDAIWSGALPDPPPTLKFVKPAPVTRPDVTFNVSAPNLKLVAAEIGKTNVFDHGYLQFVLDGGQYDKPRYSGQNGKLAAQMHVAGKYSPSASEYITYRGLPRGKHKLVARLASNDGSLIGPKASITFVVK